MANKMSFFKQISLALHVDGDVGELQLPDEHGGGLDERQPRRVEKDVLVLLGSILLNIFSRNFADKTGLRS
jgi:hypothetical protein